MGFGRGDSSRGVVAMLGEAADPSIGAATAGTCPSLTFVQDSCVGETGQEEVDNGWNKEEATEDGKGPGHVEGQPAASGTEAELASHVTGIHITFHLRSFCWKGSGIQRGTLGIPSGSLTSGLCPTPKVGKTG